MEYRLNINECRPNIVRISSNIIEDRRISSKMSLKGRTEMIIGVSGAKLLEEADFDVQKWLAHQKHSQTCEKLISERKTNPEKKSDVKKRNVGNRLKRVLAKFQAERSHV